MVILGSASPRRRELLARLGIEFVVRPPTVDEDVITTANPIVNVLGRARLKAAALQADVPVGGVVLTADTVVAIDEELLNKPADAVEARHMLAQLRGRRHQVHTAVVVATTAAAEQVQETVVTTAVTMRPYTSSEIEAYIASGDPFDKAGGYAIQHPDFRPVAQIEGCYTSVVGLPLCRVRDMLAHAHPHHSLTPAGITGDRWSTCRLCQTLFSLGSKK